MEKIAKVSRVIQVMLVIAALTEIVFWGYFGLFTDGSVPAENVDAQHQVTSHLHLEFDGLESEARQLSAAGLNPVIWLTTPSLVFDLVIIAFLFALFGQYQQGSIFSTHAVGLIRKMGGFIMIWPFISAIYPLCLLLSMKLVGVLEHGEVSLGFGSDDMKLIVTGLMITVIGWVMSEASRMRDEQELTI